MRQRGRVSSLSVVTTAGMTLDRVARIAAPAELTPAEKEFWNTIVNSEPADWFTPATVPLLVQYCRHCTRAQYVSKLITDATDVAALEDYDRLLKMQERESRAIMMLATKMRLSQQSIKNHRGNAKQGGAGTMRPWEEEDDGEADAG